MEAPGNRRLHRFLRRLNPDEGIAVVPAEQRGACDDEPP
jgi:hypothetical protein